MVDGIGGKGDEDIGDSVGLCVAGFIVKSE